jgi:hypothetical protein
MKLRIALLQDQGQAIAQVPSERSTDQSGPGRVLVEAGLKGELANRMWGGHPVSERGSYH